MKRKVCGAILLMALMSTVTGCRFYADYKVNNDGTITQTSKMGYTAEELKTYQMDETKCTLQTLEDGKQYYVTAAETETTSSQDLLHNSGMILNSDIFYYGTAGSSEGDDSLGDALYAQFSVSLSGDIVDTNADLSKEGNTAVFTTNNTTTSWYAYTQNGKNKIDGDTTAPKMSGAKNEKYYKKVPKKLIFTDDVAVKEVLWNGQTVSRSNTMDESGKVIEASWITTDGKDAVAQGKNTYQVTDLKGNMATFTIYIDTKAPVVKGIKNHKTYKGKKEVYVKDAVKLKTVKINGKSQKMTKKKLVKSGKYKGYYKYTIKKSGTNKIVVCDTAGNRKTLTVTIK